MSYKNCLINFIYLIFTNSWGNSWISIDHLLRCWYEDEKVLSINNLLHSGTNQKAISFCCRVEPAVIATKIFWIPQADNSKKHRGICPVNDSLFHTKTLKLYTYKFDTKGRSYLVTFAQTKVEISSS